MPPFSLLIKPFLTNCFLAVNDCTDAPQTTGVYNILNHGLSSFPVYCDQTNDGGGILIYSFFAKRFPCSLVNLSKMNKIDKQTTKQTNVRPKTIIHAPSN